jgi:hypothetical protein
VDIGHNGTGTPQGSLLSKHCQATRADGAPCGATPGKHSLCFWHDPEQREEMLAAARNGGSRKALSLPIGRPLDTVEARGLLAGPGRAPGWCP